jgi:hypothetical protein
VGSVLCPENSSANDSTKPTGAHKSRGAQGTLPLTANIVRLPREHARHVGVGSSSSEEDAKVAHAYIAAEADHGKADQCQDAVSDDTGAAKAVVISCPSEADHDEGGEDVRGRNQAVGCCRAKPHTVLQNDGQEVGNGVCHGRGEHEKHSEAPDLEVKRSSKVLLDVELLGNGVVPVFLNAGNDVLRLLLGKEFLSEARLVGQLGEVDDEVPADQPNDDGENTLQNKDPPPTCQARAEGNGCVGCFLGRPVVDAEPLGCLDAVAAEKGEKVAEDSGEGRRQHADEVEHGVSLLELKALVPAREKVGGSYTLLEKGREEKAFQLTREETSLEDTENETERKQSMPLLDEPKADHDRPPDDDDGRQEDTGANLSQNNGGRRLKRDVCDEEQQDNETVSLAGELQVNTHTSHHGNTKVGPVHQGDAVHAAKNRDQSVVNFPQDLFLLLWCEGIEALFVDDSRVVRVDTLEGLDLALLFCEGSHVDGEKLQSEGEVKGLPPDLKVKVGDEQETLQARE